MLAYLRVPTSWTEIAKRTLRECIADDVLNLAAQQAYYFFFALFPALLTLLSIASFFTVSNLIDELVQAGGRFVPPDVLQIIADQIRKISNSQQGGILTLGFLLTLWSSSGALVSIITTLNAAYDITEGRPWWKVRLTAIGLTLGMAFFILGSLILVLLGPAVAEHVAARLHLGSAFTWTWLVLQWPIVLSLVATGIGLVYYFAPDAEQEWVWITPGSVVATVLWVIVSLGFRLYISYFGNYNETYGTIGAIIVLLTWLYLSGLAILLGAELNSEIEHASPYGKNVGEKVAGEKRRLGIAAEKYFEEQEARGEIPVVPFPDDVNCDLDTPSDRKPSLRASEIMIAAATLLPAAIRVGRAASRTFATSGKATLASRHQAAACHPTPNTRVPASALAEYRSDNADGPAGEEAR
jgi:membrane protein